MHDYQCGICGYLYEPANGDPDRTADRDQHAAAHRD